MRPSLFVHPVFFFYESGDHLELHFSLHDALPISSGRAIGPNEFIQQFGAWEVRKDVEAFSNDISLTRTFGRGRSEEHTSELQSLAYLVCRLLLEKKKPT